MDQFDIIIIGAGPAGSAAATWAAKQGRSVALVDKATFPRTKLCGGLFTERSRAYYREIFGCDIDLSKAITRTQIAFWHNGVELAHLKDIPPLHLTMRIELDSLLQGHALAAGAHDFCGKAIAQLSDNTVVFRDATSITAPILIGADGVNSIVARHIFGAAFDAKTIGFGLEIELPAELHDPKIQPLRIDFGAANWGYGWSFPKQNSTTVGVGGLHAQNSDMKAQFRAYLETLGLPLDAVKIKGHYLPFGTFRHRPGRGNILLVGDAAGLVDPITGEGIAYALKSGQIAAQAACDALSAMSPNSALHRHCTGLKQIHRNLRIARGLRSIIFTPRWQKAFVAAFEKSNSVRTQYMRLLAGEVEYPELSRRVLTRLPRYILSSLRR